MANPNITDMTEEDAADLQFPKDYSLSPTDRFERDVSVSKEEILTLGSVCHVCTLTLVEPYVRCAVCLNVEMCPSCFANGCEIDEHKNDHDYVVIKNDFPLINDSSWIAKQELQLLNIVQQCGFGNWTDVAHSMQGKSAEECKAHYLKNYIDNRALPGLPRIEETGAGSSAGCEIIPYVYKLHDVEEPPRFDTNTTNAKLLAGYNAARSSFEVNFDNDAELLVCDLMYDEFQPHGNEYKLGRALQVALAQAYNNRLKERARRRRIIRRHGLIAFRRVISWIQRYESTITRSIAERLLIFMQLMDGIEFDALMEGLHYVGELKNRINKLLEFRQNGIKHFHSVPMYQKLSKLRQESERERKQYMNNPEYSWKSLLPDSSASSPIAGNTQRKTAPPLIVKGLPGYEKLNTDEIELCSVARVIPDNYLDYKHLLVTESKKCGYLRLAQARILLKIDVNKTRKIYDFLMEKGYITKPPQ